jgi:hypothetical protein
MKAKAKATARGPCVTLATQQIDEPCSSPTHISIRSAPKPRKGRCSHIRTYGGARFVSTCLDLKVEVPVREGREYYSGTARHRSKVSQSTHRRSSKMTVHCGSWMLNPRLRRFSRDHLWTPPSKVYAVILSSHILSSPQD